MRSSVLLALVLIGVVAGSVLAYAAASASGSLLDVDLKDVPVKQAIDTLFDGRGVKYYVQPGVKGRIVELRLKGLSLDEGLRALGDAAGFSFRVENGAYIISPGKATTAVAPSVTPVVEPMPPAVAEQSMAQPAKQPPVAGPAPPPVVINNNVSSPPPVSVVAGDGCGGGAPCFGNGYNGWWPGFTLNTSPYVFGRWDQPPPPSGWVSSDAERLLRFNWAVPRRPGFAAPYPYFYP